MRITEEFSASLCEENPFTVKLNFEAYDTERILNKVVYVGLKKRHFVAVTQTLFKKLCVT